MCECRGKGDNERYYLKKITFKYYQDPFEQKEGTNIEEYHRQIMTFIKIYVMWFAQEQKQPFVISQQRNGRAGFPEYLKEIRFDFANAEPEKELKKETVLEFYNKTINQLVEFLKGFKYLNNGHKTQVIAYWPPEKPGYHMMMGGKKDENGKYPFSTVCCLPGVSQEEFMDFASAFVNPMFSSMMRDIPEFKKSFSKHDSEEDDDDE